MEGNFESQKAPFFQRLAFQLEESSLNSNAYSSMLKSSKHMEFAQEWERFKFSETSSISQPFKPQIGETGKETVELIGNE